MNCQLLSLEVVLHDKLGYGGHSDVYKATFRGSDVAVKVMNEKYFNNESSLARFEFEVAIMWYALIIHYFLLLNIYY